MAEIGLECTLNPQKKISGVFKHLYEDFHLIKERYLETLRTEAGIDRISETFDLTDEERSILKDQCLFSDSDTDTLVHFVRGIARYAVSKERFPYSARGGDDNSSHKEGDEIREQLCRCQAVLTLNAFETTDSASSELKEARKQAHEILKEYFPFLESETALTGDLYESQGKPSQLQQHQFKQELGEAAAIRRVYEPQWLLSKFQFKPALDRSLLDDIPQDLALSGTQGSNDTLKFIRVKIKKVAAFALTGRPLQQAPQSRDSASRWNRSLPPYLHFTLYKANRDSADAVNNVCKAMGVAPKLISYAGTKDKRGITVQRMSLFRCAMPKLLNATAFKGWDSQIKVCDLEYSDHKLHLGCLKGNSFKLAIRRIPDDHLSRIPELIMGLKKNGFINYFGNQRFGTRSIKTCDIGVALFKKNWKEAVELILHSVLSEVAAESVDWSGIAKRLRPFQTIEKKIVSSLVEHSNDYVRALRQLHRNSVSLYYHAAQSLIWNMYASERVRRFGPKVVVGDLVIINESESTVAEGEEDDAEGLTENEEFAVRSCAQVKIVESEEEAQGIKPDLICIPILGPGVEWPRNMANEDGKDFLDVVCDKVFSCSASAMLNGLSNSDLTKIEGSYRRLLIQPELMEYKVIENVDEKQPVLASDLDRLLGRGPDDDFTDGLASIVPADEAPVEKADDPVEKADDPVIRLDMAEAKSNALLLSCNLPKGSYLTCLLREVLDEPSMADITSFKESRSKPFDQKSNRTGGNRHFKKSRR